MNKYVGDEIDYIAFSPALQTNKVRVNLVTDSNTKCLRMEFYGCLKKDSSINEYNGKSTLPSYSRL